MTKGPELNLNSVSAPPVVDDVADVCLAEEEERSFEHERQRISLQGLIDDVKARKKWGERVFYLLIAWLITDLLCICLQGFSAFGFHVSDAIIITLISTTTANVLGLGYVVANYLFPKSS